MFQIFGFRILGNTAFSIAALTPFLNFEEWDKLGAYNAVAPFGIGVVGGRAYKFLWHGLVGARSWTLGWPSKPQG